ncbi:SIR2 family protein [Mucilaginibacter sp.]|uniref:SIR2 family protein n=1 Tax=Mucilaginibacter sp. TaxID=1882438 RepID=UPI0032649A17
MPNIPLFLFGNGLSIALSPVFSLKAITESFIKNLEGDEKLFLTELCGGNESLNFDDFEENFSKLEDAYNSVVKYNQFIKSAVGQKFLAKFNLVDPRLEQHREIIKSIYNKYIYQILGLIIGNVRKTAIQEKLGPFTKFLSEELNGADKGFVFTLNYDLLAETIMLDEIGSENFTDFCSATHVFKGTNIEKFDFDPALNNHKYGEDYSDKTIELHHLHGSLSLFYDFERNKAIKFRSEDIFKYDIYNNIDKENWSLYPAIITGGGKSLKINEYPFEYYFRVFKDLSTYGKYTKLYIVGYSFRDDHVNDLIKRWISSVQDYPEGLLIVDYKSDRGAQEAFKKYVKKALKLRDTIPDACFAFGGANSILSKVGTEAKATKAV